MGLAVFLPAHNSEHTDVTTPMATAIANRTVYWLAVSLMREYPGNNQRDKPIIADATNMAGKAATIKCNADGLSAKYRPILSIILNSWVRNSQEGNLPSNL